MSPEFKMSPEAIEATLYLTGVDSVPELDKLAEGIEKARYAEYSKHTKAYLDDKARIITDRGRASGDLKINHEFEEEGKE